jgi:hypothetical protein
MLRAAWRVVFSVGLFGVMGLLYFDPPMLASVVDGATSPLVLFVWVLATPAFVGFLALVAVLAFLMPFLPDRDPYNT